MKKLILASTIALGLAACNPPAPNPDGGTKLGPRLLEVTIDLRNNDVKAVVLGPNRNTRTVDLSPQSTTDIEVNRIGVGFHDDNDGAGQTNPTRYVYAVLRVENNTGTALNNFTTWALDVPTLSAGVGPTLFGTMFKRVQDGAGIDITDGALIRSIEPTHGIRPDLAGIAINPNHADLQIFGPNEKTTVNSQLAATYGGLVANTLGYGYVARKNNGNARDIGATNGVAGAANSCTADSCKGFLTLAFKVPVTPLSTAPRSSRPTVFSFVFALGDQTEAATTQSIKDQNAPTIAGQPTTTFFGTPRLLGGSTIDFRTNQPDNLCQVETARASGIFTTSVMLPATVDTTAGTLNTCFGSGGLLEGNFGGAGINNTNAAILDSQGRMIVVGFRTENLETDFVVYRFKSDGQLDKTFNGPNGGSRAIGFGGSDVAKGVTIDSSNRIVVVGIRDNQDIAVARLLDDGTLDTVGFNAAGVGGVTAGKMVFDTADTLTGAGVDVVGSNIYIAGSFSSALIISDFLVAKVRSNGTADVSFGTNGLGFVNKNIGVVGTVDAANSIEAVSDTEIYVAGSTDVGGGGGARDWAVIKLNSTGSFDLGFNGTGKRSFDPNFTNLGVLRTLDSANAIKLASNGELVIAGSSGGVSDSDFAIARMTTTGGFVNTFDTDGVRIFGANGYEVATSMAFTSDGSIIVGGYADQNGTDDFVAYKFNGTSGVFNRQYGLTDFPGTATGDDQANSVMVNSSGKITLVGNQGNSAHVMAFAQYNP